MSRIYRVPIAVAAYVEVQADNTEDAETLALESCHPGDFTYEHLWVLRQGANDLTTMGYKHTKVVG